MPEDMGCRKSKDSKNTFENYHRKPKNCTDVSWIVAFIAFWCVLIMIIVFAVIYGNYTVIINGSDTFGNVCGQKHNRHFENFTLSGIDTSKKPFVFYFDFRKMGNAVKICVNHCPKESITTQLDIFIYSENTFSQFCTYDFNMLSKISQNVLSRLGPCPIIFIKSIPLKNRCVATGTKYFTRSAFELLNAEGLTQSFFLAIFSSWHYVVFLCGFALAISLLILGLMVHLTKIIASVLCSLTIITNAALFYVLWVLYTDFQPEQPDEEYGREIDEHYKELKTFYLNEFQANKDMIWISAIVCFLTTIAIMFTTLTRIKDLDRLKLLFDEAVCCIKFLPGLSIAPMIALLSLILFFFLSGYTLLCITTANYPVVTPTKDDYFFEMIEFDDRLRYFHQIEYVASKPIRRTFWIYIVGFLWTIEFIFAFEEFSISAAVAFWYFKTFLKSPSKHAIKVLFKHHFGTIAKGSAVITLLKIPRIILYFICKRIKQKNNNLWLKRLKFVGKCIAAHNHNAYAPAAMEKTDFSPSAAVASKILSENASQVGSISSDFGFVLFLSKLLVTNLTCLVGILLLKDTKELFFYMAPIMCGAFGAFCIAHVVFSIFEMTVDTLLLCVCEDRLMYGGCSDSNKCNLATLFTDKGEEQGPFQVIKVKSIQRLPFRSKYQAEIISEAI